MDSDYRFYYCLVARLLAYYIKIVSDKRFYQYIEIEPFTKYELLKICGIMRSDNYPLIDKLIEMDALEPDTDTNKYYINDKKLASILKGSDIYKDFKVICLRYDSPFNYKVFFK